MVGAIVTLLCVAGGLVVVALVCRMVLEYAFAVGKTSMENKAYVGLFVAGGAATLVLLVCVVLMVIEGVGS